MASGLVALLDDVAAIAKLAAASLDDVAGAAGKAGAKAAGVVVDDTAVTPRYAIGFSPERELPIVWKIALGSLRNKFLFLLPGALTLAHKGDAPLTTLIRAMTLNPAEILKLPQGRLTKGAPADLIMIDLGAPFRLDSDKLRSKSNNSPFDEKLLQGAVKRTFIAGKTVFGG